MEDVDCGCNERYYDPNLEWLHRLCQANKIEEVKEVISEGAVDGVDVDINGVDPYNTLSGLMHAMSLGHTEITRILLGSPKIKLDVTSRKGCTALHYACIYNKPECVQLFLQHPDCTLDIVRIQSTIHRYGETAEMLADKYRNRECSKLIKKYISEAVAKVEDDDRDIEELMKFISGQNEKKEKKGKKGKKKNLVQGANKPEANSGKNGGKKARNSLFYDNTIGFENKEKIGISSGQFATQEQKSKVKDEIDNLVETKIVTKEKSKDEGDLKSRKVEKFDKEVLVLETKIAELKLEKSKFLEGSKSDDNDIQMHEEKEQELRTDLPIEQNNALLEFIGGQISEKEKRVGVPCLS